MMRAPLRGVILAPGQYFTAVAKVACASSRSAGSLAVQPSMAATNKYLARSNKSSTAKANRRQEKPYRQRHFGNRSQCPTVPV